MMDILDLIKKRQSCRSYSGASIEESKLLEILEAGRLSPSARNSQPWTLVLASSEQAVKAVGECTRANGKNMFTEQCGAFICVLEEKNDEAFGGPDHKYFAELDIGMCVMNMCLAAHSLGVSSCILGAFDEVALKKVTCTDSSKNIKLVVALGYATDGYPIRDKSRKSFEEATKII